MDRPIMQIYTRQEAMALSKEEAITHDCGYQLKRIMTPEIFDVTSLSDVPEHLWGTPWDRLPDEYHKFLIQGKYFLWHDNRVDNFTHDTQVYQCPHCHESLPHYELGWEGWPRIGYI